MNARIFRLIVKPMSHWAAYRALFGRNRSRQAPEQGRFTRVEISRLLMQTWRTFEDLAPDVSQEPTFGSKMNVQLAALTLAFFQNLTAAGIERAYAIELISDVCWKIYQWWGFIGLFSGGLLRRNPIRDQAKRIGSDGSWSVSFPFNPPGYLARYVPTDQGLGFDVIRCPVAEYLRAQGASDLAIGTWCMLDYALAEMSGLKLKRTQTLAGGNKRCDFRWYASRK